MLPSKTKHSNTEKREEILFSLRYCNEWHIASAYHFPEKYMRKTCWVNKKEVKKN